MKLIPTTANFQYKSILIYESSILFFTNYIHIISTNKHAVPLTFDILMQDIISSSLILILRNFRSNASSSLIRSDEPPTQGTQIICYHACKILGCIYSI